MTLEYVEEIGRWLGGPMLAAWKSDERVRDRWRRRPPACMGDGAGGSKPGRPPGDERRGRRCASLGDRVEERAGCGGYGCRHSCNSDREDVAEHLGRIPLATPADDCQDCPGFVDAGPFSKNSQ